MIMSTDMIVRKNPPFLGNTVVKVTEIQQKLKPRYQIKLCKAHTHVHEYRHININISLSTSPDRKSTWKHKELIKPLQCTICHHWHPPPSSSLPLTRNGRGPCYDLKLPYEIRSHRENWQLPKTSLFSKSDSCCVLAGKSIYDHDKAYSVLRILKIDKFHVWYQVTTP